MICNEYIVSFFGVAVHLFISYTQKQDFIKSALSSKINKVCHCNTYVYLLILISYSTEENDTSLVAICICVVFIGLSILYQHLVRVDKSDRSGLRFYTYLVRVDKF